MTIKILFPESWTVKLTESKREQLERQLLATTSEKSNIESILAVDVKRDLIIGYWNALSEEDRSHIGESKDPRFISPITYKNVAHQSFDELSEFWQGTFLSACSGATEELLLECTEKKSLTA